MKLFLIDAWLFYHDMYIWYYFRDYCRSAIFKDTWWSNIIFAAKPWSAAVNTYWYRCRNNWGHEYMQAGRRCIIELQWLCHWHYDIARQPAVYFSGHDRAAVSVYLHYCIVAAIMLSFYILMLWENGLKLMAIIREIEINSWCELILFLVSLLLWPIAAMMQLMGLHIDWVGVKPSLHCSYMRLSGI